MSEAQKRTPRPSSERRDAKSLPLSPLDGFVLSRVDGALSEADLIASIGLPDAQVKASLSKLEGLGLIVFDEGSPSPATSGAQRVGARVSSAQTRAAPPTAPRQTPLDSAPVKVAHGPAIPLPHGRGLGTSSPTPNGGLSTPPSPQAGPNFRPLNDEEQNSLLEEADLDVDLRKRVLEAHRRLGASNHYSILGIPESADRKAIKRAYFELAAIFHPDRHFRKKLGSFKTKMEAVFSRLTLAHDTLSDREKRREYDAYLAERKISQAIEEDLARGLAEAKEAQDSVERAVRAEAGSMSPAPPSPPLPRTAAPGPGADAVARRDALARRLLGGSAQRTASSASTAAVKPSAASAVPSAQAGPPMPAAEAIDALRRRYEERLAGAKAGQARKLITLSESALASGDFVGAANALRGAANLLPDDANLQQKARDARVKADDLLRHTYTKQALYEETHDQWTEAARSWARVCDVSPDDANAHERAGNAALRAAANLHEGARYAQKACQLEPKNPFYRITLAGCYAAAGLALNARRELDTAAQLAPHDDTIQAMIKRVGEPA